MLTIRHLTKTYKGGKRAVDDLSLTVENGDIYGFIGHNGAGKSTTIKAVVGVLDFESGTIEIDGHDVKREPLACKQITAYIPDNPDLYEHLTGIQYLNFIADIFGVEARDKERRIREYAERFEITDALGDSIASLSLIHICIPYLVFQGYSQPDGTDSGSVPPGAGEGAVFCLLYRT